MVVWFLEDDCLAPERRLRIDYVGLDPMRVLGKIRGILMRIFEVEAIDLWERDFRWDTSGEPRGFYARWYVNKGVDFRTRIFAEITIQGTQPSDPTKPGRVTIFIGGRLWTRYEMETVFQKLPIYKALLWVYHRLFYYDIRRSYIVLCNRLLEEVWREVRRVYEMPVPERVW